MEAPPLFIHEIVRKKGYIKDTINLFSTYGGGARKGVHWKMDTVFLVKEAN